MLKACALTGTRFYHLTNNKTKCRWVAGQAIFASAYVRQRTDESRFYRYCRQLSIHATAMASALRRQMELN